VLTITKLAGAEYLISSVADGMEDYYMGAGEAPGVWRGQWSAALGLEGVVEAEALRVLVNGHHPRSGEDLLVGDRERSVRAIDVTLSVPKSVSLLWAFGTPETAATVSIAVVEATETALEFLEGRAAVARRQQGGIRRRVATGGFAVATFAHRTSRAGDPQLHTHCLIPNVLRREDGKHVAFDANPLHTWAKATGTVFLNELERLVTERLGVAWGPDRNGSRELVGFTRAQLRAFSKRTVAIEARLEADGELAFPTRRERMRADERASLATRPRKNPALTPERLRDRWNTEARAVGLDPGTGVDDLVVGRELAALPVLDDAVLFAALVDAAAGLCATESRFGEAHVIERIAAMSGGRLTVEEIVDVSARFLASELVVRLVPDAARRRPAEWSTVEHRALEDHLLADLHQLTATPGRSVDPSVVGAAIATEPRQLGDDQADAVRALCGDGAAIRVLTAPAGFGKTTALHAAATAQHHSGRDVIVLATTHKAVGELRAVGLDAQTIAGFLTHLEDEPIPAGTTVIVDEVSQLGTRQAATLLHFVARCPGVQLWCVGDAQQAQSVAAGGLITQLEQLARQGVIQAETLTENRRQQHPAERDALAHLRAGDVNASQQLRAAHGWEHQHETVAQTRDALAAAAIAASDSLGVDHVAVLAVSHTDCEDLTDRIRALRTARGELSGPTITGPGWGPDPRVYAAGDRILIHTNLDPHSGVRNGATGTVVSVTSAGAQVFLDDARPAFLAAEVVAGFRADGTPNVSHAWARTVDGAQGGTWHQVHLLGTPALDRYTGYVGQSRGRQPTHTWNTRPESDHPASLVADQRSPSEVVADAMRRADRKTLAANDDPWTLDRRLRAERDQHAAIVTQRPSDRRADLDQARDQLRRAESEHQFACDGLAYWEAERDRFGPLARLRRASRDDISRANQAVAGAHRRLTRVTEALHDAQAEVSRYEAAAGARGAWDHEHAWRVDRIGEIDDTLAHHWADVVLRAARADDPLAFGIRCLRDACATHRGDLTDLQRSLPPDQRRALAQVQADLARAQQRVDDLQARVTGARSAVDQAKQRRWGRRDHIAIAHATAGLHTASTALTAARDAAAAAARRVTDEQHAVEARREATTRTAAARAHLTAAVRDLDLALDHTRPHRIAAAVTDPTSHLWQALGPPPTTRGGLAAWCGVAEQLETRNDRNTTARSAARAMRSHGAHVQLLHHARTVVEAASSHDPTPARDPLGEHARWQPTLETVKRDLRLDGPELQPDLGLEL
jgi:conjugative relaxase-like TrwC/TraI family protein